ANLDSAVSQDVVGGRVMEIKIWQRKMNHVVPALHGDLPGPHRKRNVFVSMCVNSRRCNRLHDIEALGNPRLQLVERGFVAWQKLSLDPRKALARAAGEVGHRMELKNKWPHVGIESKVHEHRLFDLLSSRMRNSLIEQRRDAAEHLNVCRRGS